MKLALLLSSATALSIASADCAGAATWEDLLQKLYPAAKQEGTLVFNTERVEEVGGKQGLAEFSKRFPGIKVTFSGMAGDEMPARLSAEEKAGKVSIDIFRSDANQGVILHDAGILEKIDPATLTDQPTTTYFDSTFVKLSDFISNFAYNTDLVKPADAPKSYEALLDPEWKFKLALDARGGQIAHLLSAKIWDEKRFWNFVQGLKAQQPIWTTRNTEATSKITSGEAAVGTASYDAVQNLKEKGAPIEFLFLSPSLSEVRGAGIPKGAPHPAAAKLFLGWLLSPEGLAARDRMAAGTITPGTRLYEAIEARHAQITYETTDQQIAARDAAEREVMQAWGAFR